MEAIYQGLGLKEKQNYFIQLKQARYPYLGISLLCLSFLSFIALAICLVCRNNGVIHNLNILPIIFVFIIIFTITLYKFLVRKINHDIRLSSFRKERVIINDVIEREDVEPGSGVLYIPILGDFFKKLWNQEMKKTSRYFLVSETKEQYEVDHATFNLVKNQPSCYFIYGAFSNILVSIEL